MKPALLGPLLTFADAATETKYQLFYAQKRVYFDTIGLYTCLLQLAPGTLVVFNQCRWGCIWLVLLSWLLHLSHGLLLWRHSSFYLRHRTLCVVCLLVVARAVTAALVPNCTTEATATMRLFYKTGIIPLVWYSIVLPLPFWLQLAAQLAAIAVYHQRLVLSSCSWLIKDPAMLLMLHSLWGHCRKVLSALLMLLGLTGDSEIAHWAAGGGVVTNVTDAVTSAGRVAGDMGVCHHTSAGPSKAGPSSVEAARGDS
ncbi:hypothetical protein OEZ85_006914 [Tetradesmus obliquus]|uniref:Glycerophosphocholine acyltransferase 1 n=1 Tax=Tetradesmus obliquus TaxID=3088 RepID=A0ABY8TW28_TETOB|nr:hypothetical protein OEZ85_006914 [Tetradesmus obliquus]